MALATAECTPPIRCGTGTVLDGETCVAAGGREGAVDGGPGPPDGGEDLDRFSSFFLGFTDGYSTGDPVPAGVVFGLELIGTTASGDWVRVGAARIGVLPDNGVHVTMREGVAWIRVGAAGQYVVRAEVSTSLGVRSAELPLDVSAPQALSLKLAAASPGPVPDPMAFAQPATVPPSLGAQLHGRLEWEVVRPDDGSRFTRGTVAHAADLAYSVVEGVAQVSATGHVAGSAPGSVRVRATLAPEGTGVTGPSADVRIVFGPEAPAGGLVLVAETQDRRLREVARSTRTAAQGPLTTWSPALGVVILRGSSRVGLHVGALHGSGNTAYVTWPEPASWDVSVDGDAVTADAGGVAWAHPGVARWTATVADFRVGAALSAWLANPQSFAHRIAPATLAFAGAAPGECNTKIRVFVTLPGETAEHELGALEALGLERICTQNVRICDELVGNVPGGTRVPDGLTFCEPTSRPGPSESTQGYVLLRYLGATNLRLPYTVPGGG